MSNSDKCLKICERFVSLQGESTQAGRIRYFIRLSGCNLSCVYCDTRYAETGETMSLDAIMTEVRRAGVKLVEITGGEPLMQKATPTLAGMLLNEGFEVMLETNGACDITVMPDGVRRIVDCKLPGSGMWEYNLWSNFDHLTRLDEVKFVVSSKSDFECALKVIKDYSLDGKCEVLYSPVFGKVEFADLAKWVIDSRAPGRMQLQMHKLIWGCDATGV